MASGGGQRPPMANCQLMAKKLFLPSDNYFVPIGLLWFYNVYNNNLNEVHKMKYELSQLEKLQIDDMLEKLRVQCHDEYIENYDGFMQTEWKYADSYYAFYVVHEVDETLCEIFDFLIGYHKNASSEIQMNYDDIVSTYVRSYIDKFCADNNVKY
jgi:hypothetical protein